MWKMTEQHREVKEKIEQLKAKVRIEEVIGSYVSLHRSGRALMGRCPFHDDRVPSLAVYPDTNSFYCFGCRKRGDVIRFLMDAERLGFRDAVEVLTEYAATL